MHVSEKAVFYLKLVFMGMFICWLAQLKVLQQSTKKKKVEISIFKLMVFIQVCHAGMLNQDGVHEIK